jgi:hypothetical protein
MSNHAVTLESGKGLGETNNKDVAPAVMIGLSGESEAKTMCNREAITHFCEGNDESRLPFVPPG